ncbi:hypothetical protein OJF2_63190 [Aquisphaera giovannonii]|uniref:PEP-CTERM protein-sorting domain-containing protein n=1 Tax=Aquisphaera giovannonii TaxID=406548 RepID=A0A5B9WAP4_9BACT|nr:hypothetical protein [Aquisphaera giovannonii]QEH37728.1 hypothetical protein OJF2_63190 [Aquisphaera giovannonii]
MKKQLLAAVAVACLVPATAHAGLIGSTVTGDLSLGGSSNLFNPSTATVSAGTAEFAYFVAGGALIVIDFDDTSLTVNYTNQSTTDTLAGSTLTFTDSAFAGLPFAFVSSSIPGNVTATLAGDTLTLSVTSIAPLGAGVATYSFGNTAVPEPPSAVLSGVGAIFLAFLSLRRKLAA